MEANNNLNTVHEKIGVLTASVQAAHNRTDKLEVLLQQQLNAIQDDIKALMKEKHQRMGLISAIVFIGMVAGKFIDKLWK